MAEGEGKRKEEEKKGVVERGAQRGQKEDKGEERFLHRPWPSIRFIPPQRRGRKELIGLRDRMQGQGWRGEEGGQGVGVITKNVKRALQPFSRRSAGGH